MSHSVTVTRTVTSNTTSALVVNTGYLKTLPGLLKLAQLILGAACIGIIAHYHDRFTWHHYSVPDIFFLMMVTTFFIGTFCLLVSCLFSLSTGGIISKTIYEYFYHSIGTLLVLFASFYMLYKVEKHMSGRNIESLHRPYLAASILGCINGFLYLWSAIVAKKSYRGL